MAIGGFSKSRNLLARKRLQKRQSVRRALLETLETRQLLAVGPQLIGVQPNAADLLNDGEVLHVSPSELLFRFNDGAGIDPNTLDGIRVVRSGEDGIFERASIATDFGTGGQTLVEFYAQVPGEAGNGIELRFTSVSRSDSRAPIIRVSGRTIDVELNSNPTLETRVSDILQAFDRNAGTPATALVYALRLRGSETIGIGRTADTTRPLVLSGANAAKAATNFGLSNALEVRFVAREAGSAGLGIVINVTTTDRGGAGGPIVTVNGTTVNVEMNSNPRFTTTAREFVDALNASPAFGLIETQFVSGVPATRVGGAPTTYSPITLSGVTDIEVLPAYIGLGDSDREVVFRFAEALPDDSYRVEILGQGIRTLRNIAGEPFNAGISASIAFELELGAQVLSVVPQPVSRDPLSGALSWDRTSEIDVYFNNDKLIDVKSIVSVNGLTISQLTAERGGVLYLQNSDTIVFSSSSSGQRGALNPGFYQLLSPNGTLDTSDDGAAVSPTRVRYYPDGNRVSLRYSRNLDEYTTAGGELRLRVGTNEPQPLPPLNVDGLTTDPADTFDAALDLGSTWTPGAGGSQSVIIDSEIENTSPLLLDFIGASNEPGNRQIRMQDNLRLGADAIDGTSVIFYNFQGQLGVLNGSTLLNAITEQQKTRVREVLSIYEQYLGLRFVESSNLGLTIAVGDMRAITPFPDVVGGGPGVVEPNQPGFTAFEAGTLISNGQPATVLDVQDFSSSAQNNFGGTFTRAAMQAVGKLLGLGDADESEQLTIQSFASVFAPGVGTEIVLPGDVDIVHGQFLYRPDSKDIDLYQFTLPTDGRMTIEAFAERMSSASLLDSQIRLFQETPTGWEEIAANDDYYSSDSYLELQLAQGNYIVGVSASGNAKYDPVISDTGIGGRSEGSYQLRMDFQPPADSVLRDGDRSTASGTEFDGDADGNPGGTFNFWFRPANAATTKFVDKLAAAGGDGSITAPYNTISTAIAAAAAANAAQPGQVVRILGNAGNDNDFATQDDNVAYEIGFDSFGRPLPDGSTLDVPKDVTLMIDAGAILKMRRARIGVGSTSVNVDRSGGSLLVLGTPTLQSESGAVLEDADGAPLSGSVFLTSLNDSGLGNNSTAVSAVASAGDWGGIDIRGRVDASNGRDDLEREGLFLNWISNADIRFGGGQVVIDGTSQVVTPIQMVDARPTVISSSITRSADAAISATPNSFLETNFNSPAEQSRAAAPFSVDYDRVGPELSGNHIVDNSINGLQVRVRTTSANQLEKLTVAGRFDDSDIVHFVPENLQIQGTPGGAVQSVQAPATTRVQLSAQVGGTLLAGNYNYRFTSLDSSGVESTGSEPTRSLTTNATGSIVLSNIPPEVRRIYRSAAGGIGPYTLVGTLAASVGTFIDGGADLGVTLADTLPAVTSRLDARLVIDPGTVVKSQGARIDVGFGAQLIAEGTDGNSVIFTSLNDVRYGAGGTFDTANRSGTQPAARGDWGGLYVGHASSASLDYAVVAYGGGTTRVEGGFADFNAIEVHQSDVRLAHSRIELSAIGAATSTDADRGGRGTNSDGAIFIRGAQPVMVDNLILDNRGPAITINVSALNNLDVDDPGRSRGMLDRVVEENGNQGPLVRGNRMTQNAVNGLLVRGGELTSEGVWDDTDIAHVVFDEIRVPDFHHYGGLRLESSATESLVVKFLSDDTSAAGITASGLPLDNANRIGGSVQVVGAPGQPVVLTSFDDCAAGAGFNPNGDPQFQTNPACTVSGDSIVDVVLLLDDTGSFASTGPLVATIFDQVVAQIESAVPGASFAYGISRFEDYATVGGSPDDRAFILNQPVITTDTPSFSSAINSALNRAAPGFGGDGPETAIEGLWQIATGLGFDENANGTTTDSGVAGLVSTQVTPTAGGDVPAYSTFTPDPSGPVLNASGTLGGVGFRPESTKRIVLLATDIGTAYEPDSIDPYVGKDGRTVPAADIQLFGRGTTPGNRGATIQSTIDELVENNIQVVGLSSGSIAQTVLSGLATLTGAVDASETPLVFDIGSSTADELTDVLVQAITSAVVTASPGDWRSVLLQPNSNDRNVASVTENESNEALGPNSNGSPANGQFLGGLAPNEKSGDENRRLGFEIHGAISAPSDVDVYSFEAQAGTEVWLDIDRTNNSLDTVVELVDADGRTLALSDNSLAEEADPSLLYAASDLPVTSVNPLRLSTPELYYQSATGAPKDLYSTNPRDAGFRVQLPGAAGTNNLYHIRVRSSNLADGDPQSQLVDPSRLADGLTKGSYQLQVRLSEIDEMPGSSLTYADIRYAENGIQLVGVPANSPLLGENNEVENGGGNNSQANAQLLGNLLETNRQAISVAGNLDNTTDVDWFAFDIDYQRIRPTAIREYFSTVLDVDYADGIGRPDTSLYVFDSDGNLILGGLGSNLVDDQASPLNAAGNSDLARGSSGTLDPYIGSYELPAGRYFLAVTNSSRIPEAMTQFTDAGAVNPLVRLQPIEGLQLIAEDHVGFNGGSTAAGPIVPDLFTANSAVDWGLGDIVLYVSTDAGTQTDVYAVNPFTGELAIPFNNRQAFDVEDIAFRPNGELRAFDRAVLGAQTGDLDDAIDYFNIDTGTGQFTDIGGTGMQTYHQEFDTATPPNPIVVDSNDGVNPEAITFATINNQEYGFFVGNRPTPPGITPSYFSPPATLPNVGSTRPGPSYFSNVLYEFDETTGAAISGPLGNKTGNLQYTGAGTAVREHGYIETRDLTGLQPTMLIAREVTRTDAGQPTFVIRDGDQFRLVDRTAIPLNLDFEFDTGPEALVRYNSTGAQAIRDEMQFSIDGVVYEFDTGSVVVIDALSGNQLADGSTVRVRNAVGDELIFEFDNDETLNGAGNIAVPFTVGSSQSQLTQTLVSTINLQSTFGVRAETVPGTNRVSFVGASATDPVVVTGTGLSVSGNIGTVDPAAVRIPLSEAATEREFINAISAAMPSSIVTSFEAGRLNFSGAMTADFGDLETAGILIDQGSSGAVRAGRIAIRVLANDTAETVAGRIAAAVNDLGIVGLSASTNGVEIQLFGGTVATTGPLTSAGVAPGGIVTGIATIGNTLHAVTDTGGLFRVNNPQLIRSGVVSTYVTSSYELTGTRFTGLVAGPADTSLTGGVRVLFGIDASGNIHAFDTQGRPQPVFANGATVVSTGLGNANGLALSTLQNNLWTTTNANNPNDNTNRENDAGHGLPATPNNSRGTTIGGSSYYFGDVTAVNYNFPGGAAGALESVPFSLAGLSANDLPTLYFNYFMETEDANGFNMQDAFRVYASGDDGNWILLSTNNSDTRYELATSIQTQELFDVAAGWRQARVPLDRLAGLENVKLRFEFSTGASFGYGRQGGRGPEIRTISGDRLVDGESLLISGQRFEIEMGPTLTLPGGASLNDGDNVTIEGIRYVFTDGSGAPVVSPDVAVPFTASQDADQIAAALQTAVLGSTPIVPVISGLNFNGEDNDIISRASPTGINGDTVRASGFGNIGNNAALTDPTTDVDMIRIDVDAGASVTVAVNASTIGSSLDSYLRVFNAEGREIARNDNRPGSSDSLLTFTSPDGGAYFIGVSGAGNQAYSAVLEGTGTPGSTGDYQLEIEVLRRLNPILSGNRLQLEGAVLVNVSAGALINVQGDTGTTGLPVRVTADMSTQQVAQALQDSVAAYFANGQTNVYDVRGGDTIDLTGLTVIDSGPFGLTTSFSGDQYNTFNSPARAQNNNFEGIYVDDFIIGVAGRGEMVLGQPGGNTNFVANPDATNQILTGPYQFEIRGGDEYGVPGFTSLGINETFAIDSRPAPGLSIRFNDAAQLIAGDTFTVGDGPRVVTFELDDVNDAQGVTPGNIALPFSTAILNATTGGTTSETGEVIAARFRDLLNSATVQALINVSGNLLNNDRFGATSDTVVLIGNATATVPTSVGAKIVSTGSGANNRERPQGQVVIDGVKVSDSLGFGVTVDAAPRDPVTNAPALTGSPRNTITLNTERLAPGAVIMNSEFLFNVAGGINVVGDSLGANVPAASVPFVRLVNNSIVGGSVNRGPQTPASIEGDQIFELGGVAFADSVISYNPLAGGGPAPIAGLDQPNVALGTPDYTGNGEPQPNEGVVSLGHGGQLVLQFTDNLLTGSGDSSPDLMVFEVGDSELVEVAVSTNGGSYTSVGFASADSPKIDIDAYGFDRSSRLAFVRLTDVSTQGASTGDSVGADIDAVGAISSVPVEMFQAGGTGISVSNNATATLLNNVIINSSVGINVDASSASTIVGGGTFQRNTANVAGAANIGQFPSVLGPNTAVFESLATGNLYPAASSPVIDSSIDSLEDRPSLVAVKEPLGLSASPILTPQYDINGQLRVDDPDVETPAGLGENVFKDRGAHDRADFAGPSVVLLNPADNDFGGLDSNPAVSVVELTGAAPRYFDIKVIDGLEPSDPNRGSGVDDSSVHSSSVLLYRNNVPLVEGHDYHFGYDSTNGTVRLTPLAGIWESESVYTVRFINTNESAFVAGAAASYTDGEQLSVVDANGRHTTFEFDLGYLVTVPGANGIDPATLEGKTFILDDGSRRLTYEFDVDGSVATGHVLVNVFGATTAEGVGRSIENAVNNSGLNLTIGEVGPGQLQIQGSSLVTLDPVDSGLVVAGKPGVQTAFGLQMPLQAGQVSGLDDGQTFSIDRTGTPVVFEIDTNGVTQPGNLPVRFNAGDTTATVAAAIVTAIQDASLGLTPVYVGNGLIELGGNSNTRLDLSQTALTQSGFAGQPAAVPIVLSAAPTVTGEDVAQTIEQAIDAQNLPGVVTTLFGNRVLIEGSMGVAGVGATPILAIRDLAGNPLKPNQNDGTTTVSIFLGEGLDYGDAPAPYTSTSVENGPRHTVTPGLSLGPTVTTDAEARLPDLDQDDGVTFSSLYAAFSANSRITVNNTTGGNAFVSMWIDFDGDGFFSNSERIVNGQAVSQPTTTVSFTIPRSTSDELNPARTVVGDTFARIRVSSDAAAISSPIGAAPDGEVEDWSITILANPYQNVDGQLDQFGNGLDVSGDGFVSAIDVLQVINWINDPTRPEFPQVADATGLPPYVDVNGDGLISGLDVNILITYLNSLAASGEGESSPVGADWLASGSDVVLSSDWATGLETLRSRRSASQPSSTLSANDMALLQTEDDYTAIATVAAVSETAPRDQFWADLSSSSDGEEESMYELGDELLVDLGG